MLRRVLASAVAVLAIVFLPSRAITDASGPGAQPLSIEASEDVSADFAGAPHLQSFAWAQWDGKWIFIAGRTGGYHGVGQGEVDFPRAKANQKIWVIDP